MPWGAAHFVVFEIVVALAAMLGLGHVLARLLRRLSQPPVIGQMLAGMMLGPSVLGWLGRRYFGWERGVWLSDEAVAGLGWLAELGAMSYLFLMGVEFDGSCARMRWRQAAWIALAGTVVPLLMGLAMAFGMHRLLAPPPVHPASFALFFGVALSVTAFPVLARILQERELLATPLGQLALACAAVADLAAWCLLASVVGLVHAQKEQVAAVPLRVTLYLAAMLLVARPVLRGLDRWAAAGGRKDAAMGGTLVVATLAIVGSHLAGLHGFFGAFLGGVLVPHNGSIAQRLVAGRVQRLSGWLLPAFFAHAGLRLELALVHGLADWLLWMLIVGAATAGKLLATAATARLVGLDAWTSGALGILMNTRGLVELIVLRVGLELGVLTPRLYAMLVLMALITTLSTGPLMAGWNRVCRS